MAREGRGGLSVAAEKRRWLGRAGHVPKADDDRHREGQRAAADIADTHPAHRKQADEKAVSKSSCSCLCHLVARASRAHDRLQARSKPPAVRSSCRLAESGQPAAGLQPLVQGCRPRQLRRGPPGAPDAGARNLRQRHRHAGERVRSQGPRGLFHHPIHLRQARGAGDRAASAARALARNGNVMAAPMSRWWAE